ncbi:hypothetical protein ACFLXE_00035 [Chloroflexota bacterium]
MDEKKVIVIREPSPVIEGGVEVRGREVEEEEAAGQEPKDTRE